MKTQVKAIVKVTVEIPLSQPWSGEESGANVHKRAKAEAVEIVNRAFSGGARVVETKVTAVITEEL